MANSLTQAALLVIDSVAGFFSILLLLRFFMQAFRAPFNNQFGAFVVKLTNWAVIPLRKVLPPVFGLDSASLLAAYLLQVLILLAVVSLHAGPGTLAPSSTAILIVTRGLLATLRLCVYLFIGLLIVQAVVSWFSPHSPLYRPIYQMTYPVLQPLRKIIPPVSGIDLTPLIAILLAQIALLLL